MFFGEAYRAPMGERLGDFGNVLVTSRSAKTVADGTLHILFCESFLSSFHNPDLVFRQSIEFVHQCVDGLSVAAVWHWTDSCSCGVLALGKSLCSFSIRLTDGRNEAPRFLRSGVGFDPSPDHGQVHLGSVHAASRIRGRSVGTLSFQNRMPVVPLAPVLVRAKDFRSPTRRSSLG